MAPPYFLRSGAGGLLPHFRERVPRKPEQVTCQPCCCDFRQAGSPPSFTRGEFNSLTRHYLRGEVLSLALKWRSGTQFPCKFLENSLRAAQPLEQTSGLGGALPWPQLPAGNQLCLFPPCLEQQLDPPQKERLTAALVEMDQQLRKLADTPWLCQPMEPGDEEVCGSQGFSAVSLDTVALPSVPELTCSVQLWD